MGDKLEVVEYPKCPVCGSEERLIGVLAKEEESKGISPNTIPCYLSGFNFVMRDPRYPVIIGSKTSAGNVMIDMCKGCGIIRAIRAEIGEAMALEIPPRG